MYITLNCIVVAIAAGLITSVMLIAVVLLINSRTTSADINSVSVSCSDGRAPCQAHYINAFINDNTRPC